MILKDYLYMGYLCSIPILIVLYWLISHKRTLWRRLLITCNIVLLGTAIMAGLFMLVDLFILQANVQDIEAYRWRVVGPYWFIYWAMLFGQLLLPHLYWAKRWRTQKFVIAVVWIALSFEPLFNRLFTYLSTSYQDYLPSRWVYYGPSYYELLFRLAVYSVIVGLMYFVLRRWTRGLGDQN